MNSEEKPRPFHVVLVDIIGKAGNTLLAYWAPIIKAVEIPQEEIPAVIKAYESRRRELGWDKEDKEFGVAESLRQRLLK
jgi:hypothetical protein